MAGPFDAYLTQKKQQEAARSAAQVRLTSAQPDQVAQGLATAKELGEAPAKVLAFQDHFSDLLAQKKATTALTGAPKLSEWLRTDPAGALGKDDLDNLSWWEKGFVDFANAGGAVVDGAGYGVNSLRRGTLSIGQAAQQQQAVSAQQRANDGDRSFGQILWSAREPVVVDGEEVGREFADPFDLMQAGYRYVASRAGQLIGNDEQANAVAFQQSAERIRRSIAEIEMSPAAAAARDKIGGIDGSAPFTDQLVALGQVIADDPGGFVSFLAQVGGESLPGMAMSTAVGAATRSPSAAAATMGAFSAGREYGATVSDELANSGHDLTTREGALAALQDPALLAMATERGKARALVIGVLDGLSGGLASQQLLSSPIGDAITQSMAQALMGASGEALGQIAAEGRVTSLSDVMIEGLAEFVTAPVEVATVGGRWLGRESRRVQQAGRAVSVLDQASAQAQASKVRERSPDAFKAALAKAGRDQNLVYVPAQGLREYFQARDLDFDRSMAEAWGIDFDTLSEMEMSGGRVAVPMSNFAAYLAGTDAEAWVRDNATLDPDELSVSEAAAFNEGVQDDLQRAFEDDARQVEELRALESSDQQVFDGVYSQLRAAGRTVDVAEKEASVMRAFFRTMAARVGEDSLDLARRFGLRIQGPDQPGIPRRRGALDVMLNDLRAGRKEKVGRTLTEFVIDAGGVQDTGGDIAALEGPRGLVGESREEISARKAQATLDGLPSTGKGLALDELGRMAVEAGYFPELIGETQGLNKGEAADLGAALLEALREEASGRPRYVEGDGPDPARAALNEALQTRGLDPAAMTNDEIAAALEADADGVTYNQDGTAITDSAAFRAWFGDSKVVDEDGKPLVVYHGTRSEFDAFQPLSWLSTEMEMAENYALGSPGEASPQIISVYARISNPFDTDLGLPNSSTWREFAVEAMEQRGSELTQDQADRVQEIIAEGEKIYPGSVDKVAFWQSDFVENVNDLLSTLGFDGLVYREESALNASDADEERAVTYAALDPTQIKSVNNRGTFDPNDARILNQGPRGSIQIPGGGVGSGETIINLFETADLSTFSHEAAHFFLETLKALAADANAPQAIRDEMATVRKYLGVEDGAAFTTEQHEVFARSFEAYLMEGKAPSLELADVFGRMKEWLIRIYRSVAGLNVPINDEIRGVFDRMLASDAEIAAARSEMAADPLFREKPAGMSDADWRTYQRLARRSAEDAEAALREKVMARVRREKERWWKDERKEVRKDVEAQVNTEPRYRLIEAMANGQSWNGEAWVEAPDMRIDRGALVQQFGAGILAELQRSKLGGKRAIYGEDGMTPIVVADMFGFASPADMIETLQNTGKRKDAIDAEADRIMLDRYGDPFTDGTIEREAMEAIHNEQQSNKNVVEARAIAQQLGRETRGMTARLYKQRARLMLGRMTVREAAQPARFLAAERKAGRDAERAFAKIARGDQTALAAVLQAKEQQILNAALYDLSRAAEKEVAKAREKIQRFGKKSVREKLEGGYIEQIDDLLDRYDFRQRGPGSVQKSERLRDFIQRMVEDGRENELDIDDRLMDDARRVHYTKLSLDEFRGLVDTVDNLDHLGRFKQKLLNRQRQRDLDASADRIAKRVMKRGRDEMAGPRAAPAEFLRRYLNLAKTADTMMIMLDGGEEMGAVYDELKRDVTAGELLDQQMRMEMRDKLDDLYRQHYSKSEIDAMRKERMIDGGNGRAWSKLEILAVAANTGNQDNYARLIEKRAHPRNRLTPDQLQALLRELDDNDWRFVQGQWDLVNSYFPQLAEVHQRRTGTKLKKIDAQQMVAAPAFVTGGYYPISYDATLSVKAATDDASFWDRVMGGGRGSATKVQAGMTKERQSNSGGRTLKLDLGVAVEGMQKTIRVIALSEAVDSTARILKHPEVKGAFFARSLQHEYETLDLWLRDIAEGLIFNSDPLNSLARMAKLNLTTMFLAFNLKTVALQVTGLAQSAAAIGKRNLAHGLIAYLRDSKGVLQNVAEASVFMSERQRTFQKDIYDMRNDPKLASPVAGKISRARNAVGAYGFAPIQLMQFYAVDVPTWLGGYRSKIEAGVDDAVAVEYADRMVARSQDSGLMGDRAAFSRGTLSQTTRQSDIVRFWTTLGGYMITKLNRGMVETSRGAASIREADTLSGKAGAAAEMATNLTLLYVVEGLLMSLMYELWDDDDEADDLVKNVMKETGMSIVGGFPIVRDMASYLSSGFGGGGMYQTVGELPGRIWTQVQQGENDKAFRGAVSQGVGLVTGLPTTASMRLIEGVIDSDDRSWADMFLGSNPLN